MAEQRTVLLKVELDSSQLKASAKEAEAQLAKLTPELKKLRDEGKQNTVEYKALQLEIKNYGKQLTDSVKAIQISEKAQKTNSGSLREMRQELADAKISFQNLSEEARNSDMGKEMAEQMNILKTSITDVEKSFGTFTGDIGDYENAVKKALAEQNKFSKSLDSLPLDATIEDVKKLSGDMEHLGQDILVEVTGSISKMEDRLYELALAGDTTSDEFVKLQKQTAEYKKIILEVDASIDNLAESGGALGSALQLGQGVVAGYQAVVGVTALMGTESEELMAILVKLQAAQAVLSSLEAAQLALRRSAIPITQAQTQAQKLLTLAIGEGSKASKVFRGALLATGIGAIVLLITELVTNFDKVKEAMFGANEAQEALNGTVEDYRSGASGAVTKTNEMKAVFEGVRKGVISSDEALLKYNTSLGDTFGKATSLNEAEAIFVKKTPDYIKSAGLRAQADALFAKAADEQATSLTAGMENQISTMDAFTSSFSQAFNIVSGDGEAFHKKQIQLQADAVKKIKAESDKKAKIYTEEAEKLFIQAEQLDNANGIITDSDKALTDEQKRLSDERKKTREDEAKKALEVAKQIADINLGNIKLSLNNERAVIEAHYTFLESIAEDNADQLIQLATDKANDINAIEEKERQNSIANIDAKYKEEFKKAEENKELIASLEKEKTLEIEAINIDFNNRFAQRGIDLINKQTELGDARVEATKTSTDKIALIEKELALINASTIDEQKTAFQELQDVRVQQLESARDNELLNVNLTAQERIRIEKETELAITQIRKEEYTAREEELKPLIEEGMAKNTTYALSSAQQLSDSLFQIKQNQIQAELNAVQDQYSQESGLLKEQLDANIISQAEYDAKKSKLDAESQAKEKKLKEQAFKTQRTSQLINAAINTAVAVTAALGIPGAGIALAAVSAALGAAQIAIIASQPTPKFAKGGNPIQSGTFGGKSHANGGTRGVFDDGTQIEVEKDENFYILNKRSSAMINRLSALNQMGGGVPLAQKGAVMKFATGGAFASQASTSADNRFNQENAMIEYINNMPRPVVLVEDINGAQGTLSDVESRANW